MHHHPRNQERAINLSILLVSGPGDCHRYQRYRWCILSCEYLCKFSKKFATALMENIIRGLEETDPCRKHLVEILVVLSLQDELACIVTVYIIHWNYDTTHLMRIEAGYPKSRRHGWSCQYLNLIQDQNSFTLLNLSSQSYLTTYKLFSTSVECC